MTLRPWRRWGRRGRSGSAGESGLRPSRTHPILAAEADMTDITSLLTSLGAILLFGTILVADQLRWPHWLILIPALGAQCFLFVWKYVFAQPVMAPIGRDL